MALTFKQRRRRDISIGILAGMLIIGFTMRESIISVFVGPAGYVRRAPAGSYTALDWEVMGKLTLDGERVKIPEEISRLDGKPVSLHGFILPMSDEPLSKQKTANPIIVEHAVVQDEHDHAQPELKINEAARARLAGDKKLQLVSNPVTVYGTLRLVTEASGDAVYSIDNAIIVREKNDPHQHAEEGASHQE